MKIEIKDIRSFVRILDLASYAVYEQSDEIKPVQEEIQEIYVQIDNSESKDLLEYDGELHEYHANAEIENENNEIIADENDVSFWDNLILQLVERDLEDEIDGGALAEDDTKAKMKKYDEFAKDYTEEFFENGIDNLYLVDFQEDEEKKETSE